MYAVYPSECMAAVRNDQKIKARPPHTGCGGLDGDWTLWSLFSSSPAAWAGAFQGGGAGRSKRYDKAGLPHAGVPIEQ